MLKINENLTEEYDKMRQISNPQGNERESVHNKF